MTWKEELQMQKRLLKKMPPKNRVKHILYYYKFHFACIVILIFAIFLITKAFFTPKKATAYNLLIMNCDTDAGNVSALEEDYAAYTGIDLTQNQLLFDPSLIYSPENPTETGSVTLQKMAAYIQLKTLDAVISVQNSFQYFAYAHYFLDLEEVLPDDILEKVQNSLFYFTDEDGNRYACGINMNAFPSFESYHFYDETYPKQYFGIVRNTQRMEECFRFLRFLLDTETETVTESVSSESSS